MAKLSKVLAVAAIAGSVVWVGHQVASHHHKAAKLHSEMNALRRTDLGFDGNSDVARNDGHGPEFGGRDEHHDFGGRNDQEFGDRRNDDFAGRKGDGHVDEKFGDRHRDDFGRGDEDGQDGGGFGGRSEDGQGHSDHERKGPDCDKHSHASKGNQGSGFRRYGIHHDQVIVEFSLGTPKAAVTENHEVSGDAPTKIRFPDDASTQIRFPETESQEVPELEDAEEVTFPRQMDEESLLPHEYHARKHDSSSSKEVHFRQYEEEDEDDSDQEQSDDDDSTQYSKSEQEWRRLRQEFKSLHGDALRTAGNLAAGGAFVGGVAHLRRLRRRKQKEEKKVAKEANVAASAPTETNC